MQWLFLLWYYRQTMNPEAAEEKAWELYRAAAVDDNTDYMVCFFLASCHELNRTPDEALADRVTADPNAVFGRFGFGCWYALNDQPEKAREHVLKLAERRTVASVAFAVMILHLLEDEDTATDLIDRFLKSERGPQEFASASWSDKHLLEFFSAKLTGTPEEEARSRLLNAAEQSDLQAWNQFYAYWCSGLHHWAKGERDEVSHFQQCASMGQIYFPIRYWAKAILSRAAADGQSESE